MVRQQPLLILFVIIFASFLLVAFCCVTIPLHTTTIAAHSRLIGTGFCWTGVRFVGSLLGGFSNTYASAAARHISRSLCRNQSLELLGGLTLGIVQSTSEIGEASIGAQLEARLVAGGRDGR